MPILVLQKINEVIRFFDYSNVYLFALIDTYFQKVYTNNRLLIVKECTYIILFQPRKGGMIYEQEASNGLKAVGRFCW